MLQFRFFSSRARFAAPTISYPVPEDSIEKINELLKDHKDIYIDGLYSWEEYLCLNTEFKDEIFLLNINVEKSIRYQRLSNRKTRPFTPTQAHKRDISEIENLHKGGPIAFANVHISNNGTLAEFRNKIEGFLKKFI